MRASIVCLWLVGGCGVFGGGPNIEGTWEGDCETEDENDQNYDYEFSLTFEKEEKDRATGEGDFESSVDTQYGGYDISGDSDDLEANREEDEWEIDGEFDIDQGENTMDMEMTADIDGDDMTAEVTLDWGNFEETGDCTFNRE